MEGGGHPQVLEEGSVSGRQELHGETPKASASGIPTGPQSSRLARHTLGEVKSGLVPFILPPHLHSPT